MRFINRLIPAAAAAALAAGLAAPAPASTNQQFVIQDDGALRTNLAGTLETMRGLGVTVVKVAVRWSAIAPSPNSRRPPKHFQASNPADYPAANWGFLDALVRQASADKLEVGFTPSAPAPLWATGTGAPAHTPYQQFWKPNAADYGAFVQALATRYSGHYKVKGQSKPLPRVKWWSIWNEPNYGPDLGPQAIDNNTVYTGADMYRQLLGHAWGALAKAGHTPRTDTILIGEIAPRGLAGPGLPGNFSGTMPVTFLQTLYCTGANNKELTGRIASENGCPGSASTFRAQNPALFGASGFADHPYAQGAAPGTPTYACSLQFCWNYATKKSSPGYVDFAEIPRLEQLLRHLAGRTYPIWSTEFGYWTVPPDNTHNKIERHEAVSPATAALYMNWAEYLSYLNPNIASYDQYLLIDPIGDAFSTGLELSGGKKLAGYAAYETPLYMPVSTASHPSLLTVWGGIRPAAAIKASTRKAPQPMIQFQAGSRGSFVTLVTPKLSSPSGYFDTKVRFTQSGSVRIAWKQGAHMVVSRTQQITIG